MFPDIVYATLIFGGQILLLFMIYEMYVTLALFGTFSHGRPVLLHIIVITRYAGQLGQFFFSFLFSLNLLTFLSYFTA